MPNVITAIYVRVSTNYQSVISQIEEVTRVLLARGYDKENFKIYQDIGSGTNSNRTYLKELLNDCRKGKVKLIACARLDRFFRSLKEIVTIINEFQEINVGFISIKENIDLTTSTGKLMFYILSAMAEFEADIIKERIQIGLESAIRNGKKIGRPTLNKDKNIYELREKGFSIRAIAKELQISKGAIQSSLSRRCTKTGTRNIDLDDNDINDFKVKNKSTLNNCFKYSSKINIEEEADVNSK